ncbi:DNA-directed RNA polymerase subunit beta [Bienertia sinuspersici]
MGIGFDDNYGKNVEADHSKQVDEGVSVSSPKDGHLIVADAGATRSILEALEGDQTNKKQNDDDVPSEKTSEHTPSPQDFGVTGDFGESILIVIPLNVQRPHDDGSYSSIDRSARIPDVGIPEYIRQNTPEMVGNNVMEDIRSTKMEQVSFHNEEKEIADHKNDDSFGCEIEVSKKGKAESSETIDSYNDLPVANCDFIVSRTLQLQRNKYLAELSDQEQLRHTLESLVRLDIINPANPNIHVSMTNTDFFSLAPKTWLTGASIDACSYLFKRREEEKPGTPRRFWFNILPFKENIESIIAEKEIDLEKAKDNPCYDTMKAEWLKEKQKITYQDSTFFADKCRQSMSEWNKIVMFCKVFCKVIESSVVVLMVFTIRIEGLFLLLGEVIKTTSIVVFIALKLWNGITVGMRRSIRLLHFQHLYKEFKSMSSCYRFGKLQREQKETRSFQGLCFVVCKKAISHSTAEKEKG